MVMVKMLRAMPAESVTASNTPRLPPVVVKATGTPTRRLPTRSTTVAPMVEVPPVAGSSAGVAVTVMVSAPPAPITNASPPSQTFWAPPENARTVATPNSAPACSVTTACPLLILPSCGSRRPRSVVNVTNVPLWTEVPLSSTTLARISAVGLSANTVRFVLIVMMASVGATSAILSHDAVVPAATHAATAKSRETRDGTRDKIHTLMTITGMRAAEHHSEPRQDSDVGYAMAGLLVAIGVMGLLLSLAMPTWQTFMQREDEAELIFRGGQYARAITLYGQQFAGAFPPNIETLVDGRFLRKAYTDPMMQDGEFEIITPGTLQTLPGLNAATEADGASDESNRTPFSQAAREQNAETGPVMGVRSRSTKTSLKEFDGLDSYADWIFTPAAPGLLGGHTAPQTTLSGGVGEPTPGQPAGASPFGAAQSDGVSPSAPALPGAFGAPDG
jgi:type II secretory pathway pseudopilin PulG